MELLLKIKKHGFVGSIKVFGWHCAYAINTMLYYLCKIFLINEKLIVFESEGDLSDNSYALYEHMNEKGLLKKYKIVWFVDDVSKAQMEVFENTKCVVKDPKNVQIKRSYYLATCKWYIYDHCNLLANLRKREKQTVVYLSHGWGYKAAKGAEFQIKTHYDYMTATGDLSAQGLSEYWNEPLEKAAVVGYPRIDYFYKDTTSIKAIADKKWNCDKYKKVIFWMPTFRKSVAKQLSEDYLTNETGLPIFETKKMLQKFSEFLKENQILLVFKLHHLQAELPIFNEKMDNIWIVRDEDIKEAGMQLYQLLSLADALISDYSSVAIDYLVLNRPIVFTLDDYEEYDKSRGLFPKNAIDYMPGYHVYTVDELEESLIEICNDVDKFVKERADVLKNYHAYDDGKASERILEYLHIGD